MARLTLRPELEAYIAERIEHFAHEATPQQRWLIPLVTTHQALPLYLGWTETLAIRHDGTLVRWSTEDEWTGTRELDDEFWAVAALVHASKTHPPLRALLPTRSPGAATCTACNGSGALSAMPDVVCGGCRGLGWR